MPNHAEVVRRPFAGADCSRHDIMGGPDCDGGGTGGGVRKCSGRGTCRSEQFFFFLQRGQQKK